jgi:ubiquinone/menaquinone biosynthesis C-methylase UbiE
MLSLESLKKVRDLCRARYPEGEMWPHYYERRFQEFANFAEHLPKERVGRVLELGCGSGYYSAFLSQIADQVVASDIPAPPIAIHKGGLERARELVKQLEITNVDVVAASVEKLPFEDQSFDMVFSTYVMGYVSDLPRAVSEIERVLKPGGLHFCVVPTRAAAVYRLVDYQFYLMKRVWAKLFSKEQAIGEASGGGVPARRGRHLPIPAPQSGFRNWFEEAYFTTPNRWEKTLSRDGKIPVICRASTQLNPFLALENLIPSRWSIAVHSKMRGIEARLGRNRLAQNFGNNIVLVLQKEPGQKKF